MIETKAPILFQPSPGQSSVITAVLLTSKDCFIRLSQKHKIVLYLQMFQHAKLYISASTLFLKFCKFQPRYSYKIYILIEKKKDCIHEENGRRREKCLFGQTWAKVPRRWASGHLQG